MGKESGYRETSHYRCLVYHEKQTDDIYLTSCGIEQCLSGYEFHAEQRTGYHMHVILGGKGVLSVNGTSYPLHHGQMFITKPGEQTWYRADDRDPWNYCWMTFDGNNAPHYTESAGFRPSTNWLDCHVELRQFTSLVQQILDRPEMTLAEKEVCRENLRLYSGAILSGNSYEHVLNVLSANEPIDKELEVYTDYGNTHFMLSDPNSVRRLTNDFDLSEELFQKIKNLDCFRNKNVALRGGVVITIKPVENRDQVVAMLNREVLCDSTGKLVARIAGRTSIDIMHAKYTKAEMLGRILAERNTRHSDVLFVGNELRRGSEVGIGRLGIKTLSVNDVYDCNVFLKTRQLNDTCEM